MLQTVDEFKPNVKESDIGFLTLDEFMNLPEEG
jgi:hypothetical protein